MDLQTFSDPATQIAIITGLTETCKKMGVPNKYLNYIPIFMGAMVGLVSALPQENVDNIDAMLTTGLFGLVISLGYKAISGLLKKTNK